jgi:hypothetical protein
VRDVLDGFVDAVELVDRDVLVVDAPRFVQQVLRDIDRQPLAFLPLHVFRQRHAPLDFRLRHLRELEPVEQRVNLLEVVAARFPEPRPRRRRAIRLHHATHRFDLFLRVARRAVEREVDELLQLRLHGAGAVRPGREQIERALTGAPRRHQEHARANLADLRRRDALPRGVVDDVGRRNRLARHALS